MHHRTTAPRLTISAAKLDDLPGLHRIAERAVWSVLVDGIRAAMALLRREPPLAAATAASTARSA